MVGNSPPRIQVVVSAKFIVLILVSLGLLGWGYYWYASQREAAVRAAQLSERFRTPPYFINRGAAIARPCRRCLQEGKLRPKVQWDVGPPEEIPAEQQRWFLAVEDPALPVTVAGILMLPVHPALQENPAFGFNESQVVLVLYQSLQPMARIEQLPKPAPAAPPETLPPPAPPPPDPASEVAASSLYLGSWQNTDPNPDELTRLTIAAKDDKIMVHAWGRCGDGECDWQESEAKPSENGLIIDWEQHDIQRHCVLAIDDEGRLQWAMHSSYAETRTARDSHDSFVRSSQQPQ